MHLPHLLSQPSRPFILASKMETPDDLQTTARSKMVKPFISTITKERLYTNGQYRYIDPASVNPTWQNYLEKSKAQKAIWSKRSSSISCLIPSIYK
jgi:hypothetical protein